MDNFVKNVAFCHHYNTDQSQPVNYLLFYKINSIYPSFMDNFVKNVAFCHHYNTDQSQPVNYLLFYNLCQGCSDTDLRMVVQVFKRLRYICK